MDFDGLPEPGPLIENEDVRNLWEWVEDFLDPYFIRFWPQLLWFCSAAVECGMCAWSTKDSLDIEGSSLPSCSRLVLSLFDVSPYEREALILILLWLLYWDGRREAVWSWFTPACFICAMQIRWILATMEPGEWKNAFIRIFFEAMLWLGFIMGPYRVFTHEWGAEEDGWQEGEEQENREIDGANELFLVP